MSKIYNFLSINLSFLFNMEKNLSNMEEKITIIPENMSITAGKMSIINGENSHPGEGETVFVFPPAC
ncbi:hypothetical protein B4135_3147 [Caldibacillus debilis]|uniref:Uncharacterized protein n=1 Tax=Caldibacillus debilis TaxID=301148 RepID=A0A150LIF5_9BACI|nr:hypothetical protein B4135_3147 [Caldibacillus debilis]